MPPGEAADLGIPTIAVFPAVDPALKDPDGSKAVDPDNLVCRAVAALKKALPDLGVLCDVALDPFTSHGHDGVIRDGYVANDETVAILQRQAIVQARRLRHHRALRHDGRSGRRGAPCARRSRV